MLKVVWSLVRTFHFLIRLFQNGSNFVILSFICLVIFVILIIYWILPFSICHWRQCRIVFTNLLRTRLIQINSRNICWAHSLLTLTHIFVHLFKDYIRFVTKSGSNIWSLLLLRIHKINTEILQRPRASGFFCPYIYILLRIGILLQVITAFKSQIVWV